MVMETTPYFMIIYGWMSKSIKILYEYDTPLGKLSFGYKKKDIPEIFYECSTSIDTFGGVVAFRRIEKNVKKIDTPNIHDLLYTYNIPITHINSLNNDTDDVFLCVFENVNFDFNQIEEYVSNKLLSKIKSKRHEIKILFLGECNISNELLWIHQNNLNDDVVFNIKSSKDFENIKFEKNSI